jgi:hypothetical protein
MISLLSLAPGVVLKSWCVEAYHVIQADTELLDTNKSSIAQVATILIVSESAVFIVFTKRLFLLPHTVSLSTVISKLTIKVQ